VAQPLGFTPPDDVVNIARAVMTVQRDHGNRSDRRHARLKYLIADRGIDWFRGEVETVLGHELQPSHALHWPSAEDHLGWYEQDEGQCFYGLYVENGRIADTDEHHLRSALREIVVRLQPTIVLTAQQNVIIAGLKAEDHYALLDAFARHNVTLSEEIPATMRNSMACPAWPTCGLAVAEAERAMPALIRELTVVQESTGVGEQPISFRMTGCPNGCARPYVGDVGFVGTTLGKYDVFLGGDADGIRLNQLYAHNVRLEDIPELLRGPFAEYVAGRTDGEGFGDWCARRGVAQLAAQHSRLDETA
jgi:sulfite reductase (ferredoxin)